MFETFRTIFNSVKWIATAIFVVMLFIFGTNLYPIFTECWTCGVFETLYNAYSRVGHYTFYYFQDLIMPVVSVCLALWIVYETFKALDPTISMYGEQQTIDSEFFKRIYKKIFLTVAIMGLFIFNTPRNILANTFELSLDFASGVGRQVIRKKVQNLDALPQLCKTYSSEIVYASDEQALSENTRNNMVCLMQEVQLLKQDYMNLGIELFEQTSDSIAFAFASYVGVRVGTFLAGTALKVFAGKISKYFTGVASKLQGKLSKRIVTTVTSKKSIKKIGDAVQDSSGVLAGIVLLLQFLFNPDVAMGFAGLGLIIGLFIINMFYAFFIIERMLFLGVTILLLPVFASCYIFEQTRSFATTSLKNTFRFSIGLIIMSVVLVISAELNDWILGGMFSHSRNDNVSSAATALAMLKSGGVESFNEIVGGPIYFVYVIFIIGINAKLLEEAKQFAGWFGGSIDEYANKKRGDMVKHISQLGSTTFQTAKSVVREARTARQSATEERWYDPQDQGIPKWYSGKFSSDKNKARAENLLGSITKSKGDKSTDTNSSSSSSTSTPSKGGSSAS